MRVAVASLGPVRRPARRGRRRAARRERAPHFVAKISRSYWGGDHSLFLGAVEYARYKEDAQPLLFHGGRYERLGNAS